MKREILSVSYHYNGKQRSGSVYKCVFMLLTESQKRVLKIEVLSEYLVIQGKRTDKLTDHLYVVENNKTASKKHIDVIVSRVIGELISEVEQVEIIKDSNKWLEKQRGWESDAGSSIFTMLKNNSIG